jgi:guanylate kinase
MHCWCFCKQATAVNVRSVQATCCCIAGAGREQLIQQLLQRFPQRFAVPRQTTDRKPGKGEKDSADLDFVKADVLAKMVAQGAVVWSSQDAGGGGSTAITLEAVTGILTSGQQPLLALHL